MCSSLSDIFLGLLAVIFPPLPVWIKAGVCSGSSLLNIILCILGYIPGLLHAWYIIASMPDQSATVYYYERVSPGELEAGRPPRPGSRFPNQTNPSQGYVAPPAQIGPRDDSNVGPTTYGTIDNGSSSAGPSAPAPGEGGPPEEAPPSYAQAVRGDHKVQSHD